MADINKLSQVKNQISNLQSKNKPENDDQKHLEELKREQAFLVQQQQQMRTYT